MSAQAPEFNPNAKCTPTATQCPRCNNYTKHCEAFGGAAPLPAAPAPTEPMKPISEQVARWAIDGAITRGRKGIEKPPTADHWLMEYWQIGQQLAKLGESSAWDNVTPISACPVEIYVNGDELMNLQLDGSGTIQVSAVRTGWYATALCRTALASQPVAALPVEQVPTDAEKFHAHLQSASDTVAAWPKWKQRVESEDQAVELPPLPEWSKMDDLGGLVPSEIRVALKDYASANLAHQLARIRHLEHERDTARKDCADLAARQAPSQTLSIPPCVDCGGYSDGWNQCRKLAMDTVNSWAARQAPTEAAQELRQEITTGLMQAIARGWCAPVNAGKEMDVNLAVSIAREVDVFFAARQVVAPDGANTRTAIGLLRAARATLEMWKDVAPAVSLCSDIDKCLARPVVDGAVERDAYAELIYAVAQKFHGETRHQTALRYIRERESSANNQGQEKAS